MAQLAEAAAAEQAAEQRAAAAAVAPMPALAELPKRPSSAAADNFGEASLVRQPCASRLFPSQAAR
jgi:hypothetical protein